MSAETIWARARCDCEFQAVTILGTHRASYRCWGRIKRTAWGERAAFRRRV